MATYAEIRQLFSNSDLRNKVDVAVVVAAETIRVEDAGTDNHANRLVWAEQAFASPRGKSTEMLMAILAANKDLTTTQILGAADAAVQAKVDAAINIFADGS